MTTNTHIQLVHIKVTSLHEAEEFFNEIYQKIGLNSKDVHENSITYWGPFGLMLYKQNDVQAHIDHNYRLGPVQISVRLPEKKLVDELYQALHQKKYTFAWEPKKFDYSANYYSFLVFDPDDNKFEFLYDA